MLMAKLLSSDPEVGSAATGRDIISQLEDWARRDPRLSSKIARLIDDIEGWGVTEPDSGFGQAQNPKVSDLTGPGDMKSPV
jgi:hypothetical protein